MIRDFEPADQNAVERLVLGGLAERWGSVFDPSMNEDLADVHGSYLVHGAVVLVLEVDGEILATGTLVDSGDRTGRIVRMSTEPAARRRGYATLIVEALLQRAERKGMTEVHVSTDTPWASALALYEACGFRRVSEDDTDTHFRLDLDRRGS